MDDHKLLTNLTDLHIHLGSTSTPHFLWELAHDQGIRLPEKNYWKFINSVTIRKKTTYDNYLHFFDLTEKIQSTTFALERATHNAVSRAYRMADIHTIEIRFNPMLRNNGGERDLDKIIFSALVGIKKAMLEYPIKAGIILMMDRRFDQQKNEIIAEKAIKFKNDGVIGLDLAGPIHNGFTIASVVNAVEKARNAGIGITIHTGEITPAAEIWEVVTKLKPERIGHGIRAVDDPKLLKYLAKEKIIMELCPTSNIRTKAAKNWDEIKQIIKTFQKNNVLFTINSDGPEFLQIDVKKELKNLLRRKILTLNEVRELILFSRKASFIK